MSFQRGATLLLRDSLPGPSLPFSASTAIPPDDQHIAITNHREPIYERVGDNLFSFAAGSFFQNNNSILVPLTEYVRSAIFPPDSISQRPTRLVDTYCGSGLFGITLSREFEKVAGVEISSDSIKAAERNAEMNGLTGKTRWLCGKAEDIFAGLPEAGFGGEQSCVVVDVSVCVDPRIYADGISRRGKGVMSRSWNNYSPSARSRCCTLAVTSTPKLGISAG